MDLNAFSYHLPDCQIARYPLPQRTDSRLLYIPANTVHFCDDSFTNILRYCNAGDLLIFNNTRVIQARLHAHKDTGGKVEILVERILSDSEMLAQMKSNRPLKLEHRLYLSASDSLDIVAIENGMVTLRCADNYRIIDLVTQYGQIPLPAYLDRPAEVLDSERYQTVYASEDGAVAAPTAGLHFTDSLLTALDEHGVRIAYVTLHIGAGTFKPVRAAQIEQHKMHTEFMCLDAQVCTAVAETRARGGRVIAVGTTTLRCLETAALSGILHPFTGETDLFIYPGFNFQVVDAMITNFHLPHSSLLMLVSAFGGYRRVMNAYAHAVQQGYRFYSYGDAMFVERAISDAL